MEMVGAEYEQPRPEHYTGAATYLRALIEDLVARTWRREDADELARRALQLLSAQPGSYHPATGAFCPPLTAVKTAWDQVGLTYLGWAQCCP